MRLAEVKDDLSKYLREATHTQIVITRHGKPAGVRIGFKNDDDWFDTTVTRRCCPSAEGAV